MVVLRVLVSSSLSKPHIPPFLFHEDQMHHKEEVQCNRLL